MIEWKKPVITDGAWIRPLVEDEKLKSNDLSFANMYLLRDKHKIEIATLEDGTLLRFYDGKYGRVGYGFPIGMTYETSLAKVVNLLKKDAYERGIDFKFILVTEEQRNRIEYEMPGRFKYETTQDDSDYIYLSENLAKLEGPDYHKKRTNVNKFENFCPDYELVELDETNYKDAIRVAKIWVDEHGETEEQYVGELANIKEAIKNMDELGLIGAILYVNDKPVGMTVASSITSQTADIHFEKVIGSIAINGGFQAINKLFAEKLHNMGYIYLNREEDLGIEGLRKAKESYRPTIMLDKYSAY